MRWTRCADSAHFKNVLWTWGVGLGADLCLLVCVLELTPRWLVTVSQQLQVGEPEPGRGRELLEPMQLIKEMIDTRQVKIVFPFFFSLGLTPGCYSGFAFVVVFFPHFCLQGFVFRALRRGWAGEPG